MFDAAKHMLWAGIAAYAVFSLSAAIRGAERVGPAPQQPAVSSERLRDAAEQVEARARARGLGPNAKLDAGDVWDLLTPLVASGKVAPETASELVKNLIQGGREITVDTVSQLLEKMLRDKPATTTSASGEAVIQTCAPTMTVEAPPPAVLPAPPTCPSDRSGERG
ncbi:hypothetical protein [Caulobacter hibisci]|uniref:Uncharacterized protein n=1 Tax=Caulobacter hibisci TaxID=2035993 RepID=A0ABS0SZR1_9CAUL|nr:hypothetical protein [Caulobacter hibisci]MBI1685120.1 hypothetical protein [Caulobacter hibisci]